jgi:hypothetical protein
MRFHLPDGTTHVTSTDWAVKGDDLTPEKQAPEFA